MALVYLGSIFLPQPLRIYLLKIPGEMQFVIRVKAGSVLNHILYVALLSIVHIVSVATFVILSHMCICPLSSQIWFMMLISLNKYAKWHYLVFEAYWFRTETSLQLFLWLFASMTDIQRERGRALCVFMIHIYVYIFIDMYMSLLCK